MAEAIVRVVQEMWKLDPGEEQISCLCANVLF